ncbi:MAG: 16S rRNA (adenine(1518)-N(6)/adenine(1519)-N(6))-dimethyltransferase RsmA [Ignavibacteria bacterium]
MISAKSKYELYRPKKFLGQNFLTDENLAKKIVSSLNAGPEDIIIEIGPGQGVLTKHLLGLSQNFYAVEIDKFIFEKLGSQYGDKINLIHKDFLKLDLEKDIHSAGRKIKIIGNIPYNITTEILFKLFDIPDRIELAVLMMQKEVAARLTAKPDTKDYGILAIQTQLNTSPKILFNVPPSAFFPKPKVVSSVVRFDFNKKNEGLDDRKMFKELVRESFGQRRKTMKNSLTKFFERNDLSPGSIDFNFTRRPENVSINEFIKLTNDIQVFLTKNI